MVAKHQIENQNPKLTSGIVFELNMITHDGKRRHSSRVENRVAIFVNTARKKH